MEFDIRFTQTAADHVKGYRKFEQQLILDAIGDKLSEEPTTQTKNRKQLGDNELAGWELRVQKFRVFYDVVTEEDKQLVRITAVGHKEHNTLFIGGKEFEL